MCCILIFSFPARAAASEVKKHLKHKRNNYRLITSVSKKIKKSNATILYYMLTFHTIIIDLQLT